ncbi:5'-nucleotidase C-terminal domain-containing protein [Sphingobacterium wenxiniae]|uniref:5'-nucleotidase, C-terminal domain n=1 Tax=Sphingobacterium wenxiniae TaxID=683125 RepID=A0A1I6NR14_9SPHI|nr:5'-nucleotidase [Sphingobacterium wenxiniae]SFS30333.1 5'-nucleotidase, C-terminal domain [Sphingobacterium wenxiniae]
MKASFRWGSLLLSVFFLASCKTQLQPSVQHQRYYQMDGTIAADSGIVNYYTPFKAQLEAEMNRVIGYAEQQISKSREAESLAGNFFVDALLWKAKQLDPEVQASFATKGGIRAGLNAGNITIGNIFEMMPFENRITILKLKGTDMLRWAEYMAKTHGQPAGGIKLVIQENAVKEFLIDGRSIDPDATYKLATYDYLANGGDYVDFFNHVVARQDYDQRIRETLIEYVEALTKEGKNIQVQLDGRVRIIQ